MEDDEDNESEKLRKFLENEEEKKKMFERQMHDEDDIEFKEDEIKQ